MDMIRSTPGTVRLSYRVQLGWTEVTQLSGMTGLKKNTVRAGMNYHF